MGTLVIRRCGAAALLAAALLGGTAIVTTPESNAHTCAKVVVNPTVSVTAGGPPDCTVNHPSYPKTDRCVDGTFPAVFTTVTAVACAWTP